MWIPLIQTYVPESQETEFIPHSLNVESLIEGLLIEYGQDYGK